MRRGDLSNVPMPRIHVDWRVIFIDPTDGAWWRKHAWGLLETLGTRAPGLPGLAWATTKMLRVKRNMPQWFTMHVHTFQFDVIVVGPQPLWDAVMRASHETDLWVGDTIGFRGWNDYYFMARAERALVELITPRGIAVPGGLGIRQRPYEGWGHRPGQTFI